MIVYVLAFFKKGFHFKPNMLQTKGVGNRGNLYIGLVTKVSISFVDWYGW